MCFRESIIAQRVEASNFSTQNPCTVLYVPTLFGCALCPLNVYLSLDQPKIAIHYFMSTRSIPMTSLIGGGQLKRLLQFPD